jgi:hypothetical protein
MRLLLGLAAVLTAAACAGLASARTGDVAGVRQFEPQSATMSMGQSGVRLYRTSDGGSTWKLVTVRF